MMDTPSGALLSPCGHYRYLLWRTWEEGGKRLLYIMLNPSTADSMKDDATIRVCRGRAKRLGYGGLVVVNLFALRTTKPQILYCHPSPVSEPSESGANDSSIAAAIHEGATDVICAWGQHGWLHARGPAMFTWLKRLQINLWALKLNADGSPAHPLRIPYSQPLVRL